ncbi:MAG: hypothetical protein MSS60_11370 [Clostridiales bacterium]|nr:hypothetical protein [Clostridiales bacterium]
MKKWICAILALSLVLAMTACGGKKPEETTAPAANIEGTMEELLNKVIEQRPVEFAGGVIPIDLTDTSEEGLWAVKSFTGLEDASLLTEAAAYEPMMGSIPFSMVMVRTAEGADPKAVAEAMKAGVDPRKWICVEADDVKVAGIGDVVMLIMVSTSGDLTAQSFVDAVQSVAGRDCDFVI